MNHGSKKWFKLLIATDHITIHQFRYFSTNEALPHELNKIEQNKYVLYEVQPLDRIVFSQNACIFVLSGKKVNGQIRTLL